MIDFTEIPQANLSSGEQDSFELFARDFLAKLEFEIIEDPSRGSDSGFGKDLIILESKEGLTGIDRIKWLVSCKHFAYSGNSVGVGDEISILDRVKASNCDGFMGFYSTLMSSGLQNRLLGLKGAMQIKVFIFDNRKIEEILTTKDFLFSIGLRYFPISFSSWLTLRQTSIESLQDHSDIIIRGTYTCDLERGLVGNGINNSDFHWNIVSIKTDEKYLTPYNNAKFTIIENRQFDEIDLAFLRTQTYSTTKLSGQHGTGLLRNGIKLGYITQNGYYGKMEIISIGYNLEIKYKTYLV
jgi:hypothetical protein